MDVLIHEASIIMKFYEDLIMNFQFPITLFADIYKRVYFLTLFGALSTLSAQRLWQEGWRALTHL